MLLLSGAQESNHGLTAPTALKYILLQVFLARILFLKCRATITLTPDKMETQLRILITPIITQQIYKEYFKYPDEEEYDNIFYINDNDYSSWEIYPALDITKEYN